MSRYTGAAAIAVAAVWLRIFITPILGSHSPYITIYFAIALSTFFFGIGPGIVTLLLSHLAIARLILAPVGSFRIDSPADRLSLALSIIFSSGICMVIARLESIQQRLIDARDEAMRVRDEAQRAAQAKEDLLSLVSHELRNPINSIALSSSGLRRGAITPERVARAIDRIERATRALAKMVDELVESTRVTTGQFRINPIEIDLVPVVGSAVELNRLAARVKQIGIIEHLEDAPVMVLGDPDWLLETVSNLLDNAIKFTPLGGRIEIALDSSERGARITVQDTGEGIDPEFLPRIFERFTQAEPGTGTHRRDLGLGLSIVKHVTQLHGGTINVESEGRGKGAKFTLLLPTLRTPAVASAQD